MDFNLKKDETFGMIPDLPRAVKSTNPSKNTTKPITQTKLTPAPSSKVKASSQEKKPSSLFKKSTQPPKDDFAKALEIDNKRYEAQRQKDADADLFKRQMKLMKDDRVKSVLKKDRTLQDSFFKNTETMSDEDAIAKLHSDYEDNQIKSCLNSNNPKDSLSKRGKSLIGSDRELTNVAVHDIAFANKHGIPSSEYMSFIGGVRSDYTPWLVTSNHIATEYIKKLPEEQQANALNKYYTLQKQSPNDAMEYIRLMSHNATQSSNDFWNNNLSMMNNVPEYSPDDFSLWEAKQDILSAMGNEKDEKYYKDRISTGTFYNNYTQAEDFAEHVKKGREMPWGPAMVYLSSYTADQLGDKKHTIYDYMTEKEKDIYAYTLSKYGETPGDDYLAFLEDDLEARRSDAELLETQEYAEDHPFLSSIYTGPASAVSGIQSFYNIGRQALFENLYESTYKPNSVVDDKNYLKNKNDMIVDTVASGIDNDFFREVYEGGMDFYQEAVQNAIYGEFAPVMKAINEAGNNADDALGRGVSKEKAFALGIGSGITEYAISKSLNNITSKKIRDNLVEHYISPITSTIIDNAINGDLSEYNQLKSEFIDAGLSKAYAQSLSALDTYFSESLPYRNLGQIIGSLLGDTSGQEKRKYTSTSRMSDEEFDAYIDSISNP